MNLNLGCGQHMAPRPEWVNIDSHRFCDHPACVDSNPDLIADIREPLPFDDASVDAVYCGHVLEHLPQDVVIRVLREIRRVLKPEGRLGIVGPDFDRAELIALSGGTDMRPAIWPGDDPKWPGAGHAWCATGPKTLELVREVFPDAVEVPITELDPFWPAVVFLEWQFAVVA